MIDRHFVSLAHGQVHYLRAGTGAPIVLAHPSPMSAEIMREWIEPLSRRFTVFAPDTAGYGQSDPLALAGGVEPTIDDYAQRMVEFADALGLERFIMGGTHTGSKIALATTIAAPDKVAHLVMDGLGIYTAEELEEQLERYTPPIVPNWYGGHLLEAWHRVRNMWTFWPWYRQETSRRLPEGMPSEASLHQMTFDMLRASPDWGISYRAAFRYDAPAALKKLRRPATLIAKHGDPLHEHLNRLEFETKSLEIRSVSNEQHLQEVVASFPGDLGLAAAPASPVATHSGGTSRRYVRTEYGSSHVRIDGNPGAPAMLLLHGSPGSADSFAPLIEDLAKDHLVISPDTLGNGYSSAPTVDEPDTGYFASATAAVLDALELKNVKVYGSHTGACIGLELSIQRPDLVEKLIADGLPILSKAERDDLIENYFIDMTPQVHGEHLVHAWHVIRDAQLWWPWYNSTAAGARPTAPSEPERLNVLVLEYLKSGATYEHSYRAAFQYDAQNRIKHLEVPAVICAAPDDMLRESSEIAGSGVVEFVELDPSSGKDAAWVVRQG